MADFIKCKQENGFLIFDTIEKYPENIADDILDEFVKQDLESIIYKSAGDPFFRLRAESGKVMLN